MPKLYYMPGACSLAPHIVLEWIGAPYEAIRVQRGSAELKALNPAGAVPVLEDDGWILTQAGAILHYLAHKHPQAGLGGPGDPRGRAELDRWADFLTGDLHPAFFPVFTPQRYTTASDEASLAAVRAAGLDLTRKNLGLLEARLAGREYILGARSIVDAYAFPMIRWALGVVPEKLEPWPNIRALFERLSADPAVKAVLAREAAKEA